MNPDDFEESLRRQPLREIPADWRESILPHAIAAREAAPVLKRSFLATLNHHLSTLLWPHPKAWGALAAVWIAIAVFHFSGSEPSVQYSDKSDSAPDVLLALRAQGRLLDELVDEHWSAIRQPSPPSPTQPRSERSSGRSMI